MSAVVETLIFCDSVDCREPYPYASGDYRSENANVQRARYVADDWHYVKGKDICPSCWDKVLKRVNRR